MAFEQSPAPLHGRGGRRFPEMKNRQLKERAVAFYGQHKVTEALEKLLNELFLAAPSDVYGYMSEYFHHLSLEPVISNIVPHVSLDSHGGPGLLVDLHCTVNGVERWMCESTVSMEMYPVEPDPPSIGKAAAGGKGPSTPKGAPTSKIDETTLEENVDQLESVKEAETVDAFVSIKKYIVPALKGLSPKSQVEVDEVLMQPHTKQGLVVHPSALFASSCAIASCGAQLTKTPLFLHLANIVPPSLCPPVTNSANQKGSKPKLKFTMPIPVVSALAGGQLLIGKLRFREFCMTPLSGSPFPEQIKMLTQVHTELGKAVQVKAGVSGQATLPNGAYCPSLDKPDQGLDLIRDACKNASLQLNENIGVIIDVGADKHYDQDKGKYELIAGQWKSTDDIINMYSDLLQSYPGLLGFIDPLHHKDVNGWCTLQERLGKKCLLIAEQVLSKGLPLKTHPRSKTSSARSEPTHEEHPDQPPELSLEGDSEQKEGEDSNPEDKEPGVEYLSCAGVQLVDTVWSTIQRAAALKGNSHYLMLALPPNMTVNTVPADLAVAMHCRFIRMGAPTGVANTLLSRLLYIREELSARKIHEPLKAHVFASSQVADGQ